MTVSDDALSFVQSQGYIELNRCALSIFRKQFRDLAAEPIVFVHLLLTPNSRRSGQVLRITGAYSSEWPE
jgi:hypothetical protein